VALNYHTLNWWVFIIYSFVGFAFESCIFFMDDNIQGYVTQYKNNFVSLKKKEISNLTATFRNKILIRKRCKIDMNRDFYYWLNLNWAFTSFLVYCFSDRKRTCIKGCVAIWFYFVSFLIINYEGIKSAPNINTDIWADHMYMSF
jgi:hypothetical protein